MSKFPFFKQLDEKDCGPTCIKIISKYYGKVYSTERLRDLCQIKRYGTSLLGISDGADEIGLRNKAVKITTSQLRDEAPLPCILHWKQNHFVVLYKVKNDRYYISDPSSQKYKVNEEELIFNWIGSKDKETKDKGFVMLLEPSPDFYSNKDDKENKQGFSFLFKYLRNYKQEITQTILAVVVSTVLQLILPFLTQSIIDIGINNQNLNFVQLILLAQVILTITSTGVSFIQSWIALHVGAKLGVSMLSDFLHKLLQLPISFFNSRSIGDILQRMNDNNRVLSFITGTPLTVLFSLITLVVYGVIMTFYSLQILLVFFIGNVLYVSWIILFLKKRRELDYEGFEKTSEARNSQIQLITHVQDIKLGNVEKQKRWEWENIQASIYRWRIKGLKIGQLQQLGSTFINQIKNLIISYLAAYLVINGEMTLGMMVAVQYMIGQLQQPFSAFIGLIQSTQDVKISLERLGEVTEKETEQSSEIAYLNEIPERSDIVLENVDFTYEGKSSDLILKRINAVIPFGKTTAIVGLSGSGKSTLMKLLLKLYHPTQGRIKVGDINLENVKNSVWRGMCGSVLQESSIFEDTIANNIALDASGIDFRKLQLAIQVANLQDFISNLPLNVNTLIGKNSLPLSEGQKQRVLIARMVYKNPEFVFMDEATSNLDAENEAAILRNLQYVLKEKTKVIIAHRLSTVKNADQILVIDKGEISESGNHEQLLNNKGRYYQLVKNQLNI